MAGVMGLPITNNFLITSLLLYNEESFLDSQLTSLRQNSEDNFYDLSSDHQGFIHSCVFYWRRKVKKPHFKYIVVFKKHSRQSVGYLLFKAHFSLFSINLFREFYSQVMFLSFLTTLDALHAANKTAKKGKAFFSEHCLEKL